ncbi:hypothetical protein NSA47_03155 [Irregularibacter muris]|uniref:Zinc ribbon domain-containing protein n=1 Tax=Irregularibacter muris TaxID=1796619 RepID=A0AAE3HDE2_9FIRM|nr:CD1247 N-terminal domain-containing protein [Irregularibacter muris]MCR1897986.1 hypothetical protein [Irregularibacter muris]
MDYINEKVAYLRGLAEGLGLNESTNEGKVILHMVDILDDISDVLEGLTEAQNDLEDYMEVIDEDLAEIEEDFYDLDDEDEIDFCQVECPECGEIVFVDMDMLDEENAITCPNCQEEMEVDLTSCEDDDCECKK